MMAHESPSPALKPPAVPKKQRGKKDRKLPNGDTVVFDTKRKDLPAAVLPDGGKPDFANGKDKKKAPRKKSPSAPKAAIKKDEETYAGSSFHSSPAALALPKPLFKLASPKPASPMPIHSTQAASVSPIQQGPLPRSVPMTQSVPPGIPMPQGVPPVPQQMAGPYGHPFGSPPYMGGPPQYPLGYPPHVSPYQQTGFLYHVNPQGYINYQYPAPRPAQPYNGAPVAPVPPQQQGQKISFNELLGSGNH